MVSFVSGRCWASMVLEVLLESIVVLSTVAASLASMPIKMTPVVPSAPVSTVSVLDASVIRDDFDIGRSSSAALV